MTNFPTTLDELTNPTATDTVAGVDHAAQHANVNDAIEAIQAKLGVNSSAVTTSHDYKLGEVTSTDKAVSKTATQTLTNKTLTSPVLTTPQINDTSLDHQYVVVASELAADRNVTLPLLTGNDEFVFKDHAATLTNKTIDGDNNTIQDLPANTVFKTATAVPIANGGTGQTSQTNAFDALSPTTTKGDLIVSNGSDNIRVAVGSDNQILIADTSQASGVRWGSATSAGSAKIEVDPTEVSIVDYGGGTETTLFDVSIPGGTLSTNNALRVTVYLSLVDVDSSDTLDIKFKYGGTTIATLSRTNATANTLKGFLYCYLIADGATNVQKGTATLELFVSGYEASSDANVGFTKLFINGNGTAAVDSTASQTLSVTAQYTGASQTADDLTAEWWIVEKIA